MEEEQSLTPPIPPDSSTASHTRTTIHPLPSPPHPRGAGMGRLVTFSSPQPLTHLIERIARGVGTPKGFPVAIPQGRAVEDVHVRTVAVCAGSGGAVLRDVAADLYFAGEMGHHEALAATERGGCVVTLFHSNSARGFLHGVLRERLARALREEWARVREEEMGRDRDETADGWDEALQDESVEVEVSAADRDPFGIVILQASKQEGTVLGGEGER